MLASGIYSLAPAWSSVFDKWDSLKRFQKEAIVYDLAHFIKTPVAEAWKWDPSYFDRESKGYCPECSWFSWSYSYVVTGEGTTIDKDIVKLKGEQFCDHWCSRHSRPPVTRRHKSTKSTKDKETKSNHKYLDCQASE